jgi:hypothetical protein
MERMAEDVNSATGNAAASLKRSSGNEDYAPPIIPKKFRKTHKGLSTNDVTVVGREEGQGFRDNSTDASVIKSVTIGGGQG